MSDSQRMYDACKYAGMPITDDEEGRITLFAAQRIETLADKLTRLRDQVKTLADALESAIHEIKMETWVKFNGQGEFENVAEKSPVIIAARAALDACKESK